MKYTLTILLTVTRLMMRIDIISCVPNLLDSFFAHSILKRAQEGKFVEVVVHDLRDYSVNKHRSIDDYAFGGGAGMVLQIEPIAGCIRALQSERTYDEIIYLTPDGELMEQKMVNQLSLKGNLIMLCGHYKGVDQRVRDLFITKEITLPFALQLADKGAKRALLDDPHLLNGLNVHAGKITFEAVARDLGYDYVPAAQALG